MSTLDQALSYVASGLPVLPLAGKKPVTAHGVKDASLDPAQLREWWSRSDWNVGCAVPEGYVVLDVDPRNGGLETAAELTRALGALPETLRCFTGGSGWHVWLRVSVRASELRGKLGDGLDVKKASGGYVVLPPSVHPDTGRPYEWHTLVAPAAAPRAWVEALRRPVRTVRPVVAGTTAGAGAVEYALGQLRGSREGGRNSELFKQAVWLAELGWTTETENALATAACELGLEEAEVLRTLTSARDKAK